MKKALSILIVALYLMLLLCACGNISANKQDVQISEEEFSQIKEEIISELQDEILNQYTEETVVTTEPDINENMGSAIRAELKEFLDSYEDFVDEYVVFINEYYKNPTDLNLLSKYADIMEKYTQFISTVDNMDTSDFSDDELLYYIEVTSRASQKLLSALSLQK